MLPPHTKHRTNIHIPGVMVQAMQPYTGPDGLLQPAVRTFLRRGLDLEPRTPVLQPTDPEATPDAHLSITLDPPLVDAMRAWMQDRQHPVIQHAAFALLLRGLGWDRLPGQHELVPLFIATTHHLKCQSPAFEQVRDGEKWFEYRKNDRPYAVGDRLILRHYDAPTDSYDGQEVEAWIQHMTTGFGIPDDHVILHLCDVRVLPM